KGLVPAVQRDQIPAAARQVAVAGHAVVGCRERLHTAQNAQAPDKRAHVRVDVVGADPRAATQRSVAEPRKLLPELSAYLPLPLGDGVDEDAPLMVPRIGSLDEDAPLPLFEKALGSRGDAVIGAIVDPAHLEPAVLPHARERRPHGLRREAELPRDLDEAADPGLAAPRHNVIPEEREHHRLRTNHYHRATRPSVGIAAGGRRDRRTDMSFFDVAAALRYMVMYPANGRQSSTTRE